MNRHDTYQPAGARKRRLWLPMIIVGVVTLLVLAFFIVFPIGAFMVKGFPAQPAVTVATLTVHYENWEPTIEAVGTLTADRGADLSTEVGGIVEAVNFDSGGDVKAGAPLIKLRNADDVARLHTLEAARDLAQLTFKRDQTQLERKLIAQVTFDATAANLKSVQAQVAEQQAIVNKKVLHAPFAGHLGIRSVNVGQFISPGTVVVTLQALDPINLDFRLPQQSLQQVKVGQSVAITVDTYPGQTFTGRIATVDPKVDPETRNVLVRAQIPNVDRKLLPGMFAKLTIGTGETQRHLTVPQTAITYNPYGNMVYAVQNKADKTGKTAPSVQQTVVTTGETRGDQVAILSGLKEGDVIVTAGQTKLQNGMAVAVNNAIQPSNEPNPMPTER